MRKIPFIAVSLVFLTLPAGVSAETVSVITKDNAIRQECRFLAPVKARVHYGDRLEVSAQDGDWLRVQSGSVKGCIHKSAVTEKAATLTNVSSRDRGASNDEVALAGKGFNPEVEKAYRGKHPELDFATVDSIEGYAVSDQSLKAFISAGGLVQP